MRVICGAHERTIVVSTWRHTERGWVPWANSVRFEDGKRYHVVHPDPRVMLDGDRPLAISDLERPDLLDALRLRTNLDLACPKCDQSIRFHAWQEFALLLDRLGAEPGTVDVSLRAIRKERG